MKRSNASLRKRRHGGRAPAGAIPPCAQCQPAGETGLSSCSRNINDCRFCEAKLYSGLPGRQVNKIRSHLSLCRVGPREALFRAGDPSRQLYVIREGQIKLTRTDIDGHEHLLNLAGPGYFLGFDTIGNPSYSYSAETLTPAVLCRIRHSDMVRLLKEEPRVSLNVLLAVNEQLAHARNLMRALGQKTAVQKVAALLLNLYPPEADGGTGKAMALHLSRHEMAKILGLTVETVSRIMAALRRKGIINAPRGRIVISARARLRALAGHAPAGSHGIESSSRRKQSSRGGRERSQGLRLS